MAVIAVLLGILALCVAYLGFAVSQALSAVSANTESIGHSHEAIKILMEDLKNRLGNR